MSSVANLLDAKQLPSNTRRAAISHHPSVFTNIYQEDVNIAIWQRELSSDIQDNVNKIIASTSNYNKTLIVTPKDTLAKLVELDNQLHSAQALCQNIAELVDMFCLLYELKQVGLRLTTLDRAMCPRFHVDKVPCRLVCTYYGVASEWIAHDKVDRSKLGRGNMGLTDDESGLFQSEQDINKLTVGDVAMLKGELWQGNENAGLVHRSPNVQAGEKRLLLTLDFMSD